MPSAHRSQLKRVLQMARDTPPARCKQQRRLSHNLACTRICHAVGGFHEDRGLAPDHALAVELAKGLALLVRPKVEPDASKADDKNEPRRLSTSSAV